MLVGHDLVDITGQHEPGPLVAAPREANESAPLPRADGLVWLFRLGSRDADRTLAVGVRGEIGALAWYAEDDELVPVCGVNDDEADRYWTWFGDESAMPARA